MLDICIMGLLRMRMDALHYALLAVVVLLAVYCGASFFREASTSDPRLGPLVDSGNRKLDTINSLIDEKRPRNDTRIMKKKIMYALHLAWRKYHMMG